ncbi:MAG TPA: hypothetical protein DDW49_11380 [Deltaproteobacteria bacterium]|nr:MAG: hypothetical protein A2048_05590 [Deltaproteobacteria bacterium GWA2_45_12]HBF13968.1 hypothetical protein [Deltaproteobacteria bacterium]
MPQKIKREQFLQPISLQEIAPFIATTVFLDSMLFFVVDDYAMGFVRGALVQKVADRHHAKLRGNALNILVLGDLAGGWGQAAKNLMTQLANPWTYLKQKFDVLSWGEEAGRTLAIGVLFDHYLATFHSTVVQEKEAVQIRKAIEQSLHQVSFRLPPSVIAVVKNTGSGAVKSLVQTVVMEAGHLKKKGGEQKGGFKVLDRLFSGVNSSLQEASIQIVQALAQEGALFVNQLKENFDAQWIKYPKKGAKKSVV